MDNMHHYAYDGENRLVSVDSGSDGGIRVRCRGKASEEDDGRVERGLRVRPGGAGDGGDECDGGMESGKSVCGAGGHVATYASNTTYFDLGDWLGTERVRTTAAGVKCETVTSLAFGDGQAVTGSCGDPSPLHFTGKQRDAESGLDNFGARYNSSSMGRFMSPDWSSTPAAVPFADPGNPQSFNLYSYVTNNPQNRTDPLGHNWFCTSGTASNCGHWTGTRGSAYTNKQGNELTSNYTGLLAAEATGTDKKTGATLYKLTLYDQDKAVATGTGFSGGNGMAPIRDGNYLIRLDIRDRNGPNTINPNSALNNPPPFFGIQKMHDITDSRGTWEVVGAYGPIRARLNADEPKQLR